MANGESAAAERAKDLSRRTWLAVLVVVAGLAALYFSVDLVVDAYQLAEEDAAGDGGAAANDSSVSAASVVAVLTPVIAGIVGIVGLYFGVSSTGSSKGQRAEADQLVAETGKALAEGARNESAALSSIGERLTENTAVAREAASKAQSAEAAAQEARSAVGELKPRRRPFG